MRKITILLFLSLAMGLIAIGLACNRSAALGLGLDTMYKAGDTAMAPTIRIEKTVLPPIKLLSISFQVFKEEDIPRHLNTGYVELCNYINKNRLPAGRVMGFYYTYDMPHVIEAAVEVDSLPAKQDSLFTTRIMAGGNVLIAHYKGPYEKAALAYHAIDKWLAENQKLPIDHPFEVYVTDPLAAKNKSKHLTDIYQFYK